MAKWNPLALKLVMWLMGILIAAGSAAGFIGGSFFQFDQSFGVTASVAGIAFGAGLMIAGFDPIANVSWVRALVIYAILQVVYQLFAWISIGRFDLIPFVIAIIAGALAPLPLFLCMRKNLPVFPHRRAGFAGAPALFPADEILLKSLHATHGARTARVRRPGGASPTGHDRIAVLG